MGVVEDHREVRLVFLFAHLEGVTPDAVVRADGTRHANRHGPLLGRRVFGYLGAVRLRHEPRDVVVHGGAGGRMKGQHGGAGNLARAAALLRENATGARHE